jgi:hypothetical protein
MLREQSNISTRFNRLKDLIRFLYVQRVIGFETPTEPSFDQPTRRIFQERIVKCQNYLEFGSGGSTIVAARHQVVTTSVENDRFYAASVKRGLPEGSRVCFIDPKIGLNGAWGNPIRPKPWKGRKYISAPWTSLTEFPDLILIDGRYRVACALECARQAHERAAVSEILFDDYGQRPYYHWVEGILGKPQMHGRSAVFPIGENAVPVTAIERALHEFR